MHRSTVWKKAHPEKAAEYSAYYREWQSKPRSRAVKNSIESKRRAAIMRRTPSWLTTEYHEQISIIYQISTNLSVLDGIQYNVDHILPLQGELVSGLHVPSNLQIITKLANSGKRNRFKP